MKIAPHRLSCRTDGWQSQDVSQQLPSPLCYGDQQWLCSCDLIQLDILCGHWIPITFLAVFYENCFVFFGHSLTHPRFLSCITTLFTNFWYSQILVVRFFFQISFQIALFFARATAAIFLLLWMSFQSPSFDPSFITFPYSLSSSLDPLFTVVYSVFSSVCAFHYVSWLLIIFQTAVFTSLAVIFLLSLFAPVMNFLMWFMFSLLKCFMKCGSMIFWTSCGCDTYRS